jgi:outer membrane protein assembly factor BamE (lipoprotein component of BamABCDE complex)
MQLSGAFRAPREEARRSGVAATMFRIASRLPRAAGLAAVLAAALGAASCNPISDNLGNRALKENVAQIQVGRTTKLEVTRLLGSPSNVAAFDPNTWYYISARQVQYAFLKPKITEQHVLRITFDESGVVREMKELGLEDVKETSYVERTTPTRGGEPGLLRSLYDTIMRGPITRKKEGSKGPDY